MDWQFARWSVGYLLAATVVAVAVFRNMRTATILGRVPLFLLTGGVLLYLGLFDLPASVPRMFNAMIGHSIGDNYAFPAKPGETQISGTWVLLRWMEPLQTVFLVMLLVAFLCAIVNLASGRAPKLNLIALGLFCMWLVVGVYFSLACFPFCV